VKERLQIEEAYCPIETYSIRVHGKRHPVVRGRPLVTGYLFVRCVDPYEVADAMRNRGLKGVLKQIGSEKPAVIHDTVMFEIKKCEWEMANSRSRKKTRKRDGKKVQHAITVGDVVDIPSMALRVKNGEVAEVRGDEIGVETHFLGQKRVVWAKADQVVRVA
jgi:transcription antitermination factor NusG